MPPIASDLTDRIGAGQGIGARVRRKNLAQQPVDNFSECPTTELPHNRCFHIASFEPDLCAKPTNRNGGIPSEDVNEWTASLFAPDSVNRLSVFDRGESPAQASRCLPHSTACQLLHLDTHVACSRSRNYVCAGSLIIPVWRLVRIARIPLPCMLDTCYDVAYA